MTTTDTTVSNLIINTMTQAQYNQITPSATELYLVTDSTITSSEVTMALGYTPANTTLSNLGATSSTNFDGQIIKLSNHVSVSLSSTINQVYTIDLSDYITFPDNTYDYEIYGILSISGSNDSRLSLSNSNDVSTGNAMAWLRSGSNSRQDATCFVIPVSSTSRKLYYKTENAGFTSADLSVWGYRRIGTNT